MNKFDKLASEILASYNDLTLEQKNNIDYSKEDFIDTIDAGWILDDISLKNISNFHINYGTSDDFIENHQDKYSFYYVKNPKDRKLISFIRNHEDESWKWLSINDYGDIANIESDVFSKNFRDVIPKELKKLIEKIPESLLEQKAIQAVNLRKNFKSIE